MQKKAKELNINNINLFGDLLDIKKLNKKFDVIESVEFYTTWVIH